MARKKTVYTDPNAHHFGQAFPTAPSTGPSMTGTKRTPRRVLTEAQKARRAARQALGIQDTRTATREQLNAARFASALGEGKPVTDPAALAVAARFAGGQKGGPAGGKPGVPPKQIRTPSAVFAAVAAKRRAKRRS